MTNVNGRAGWIGLIVVLVAAVSVDLAMSLAGRESLLIRHLGMSLQAAAIAAIAMLLLLGYALSIILLAKQWRWFFSYSTAVVLVVAGSGFLYVRMCEKSMKEAREATIEFLGNPRSYSVSYGEHVNENMLVASRNSGGTLTEVYAFHPHGRYVFRLRSPAREDLMIQLNRDRTESRVFVYTNAEYSARTNR